MPGRCRYRYRDELILAGRGPADETQPPPRPKRRAKVRERGVRIIEEHDPKAREHDIEALWRKRNGLRVRFLEPDIGEPRFPCKLTRSFDQQPRDVDAGDETARADAARQFKSRLPA